MLKMLLCIPHCLPYLSNFKEKNKDNNGLCESMVPGAGLEPAQCFHRRILSPLRLPISPPGHTEGRLRGNFLPTYKLRFTSILKRREVYITKNLKGNVYLCYCKLMQNKLEARVGIEPTMAELQSTALPLCYRAHTFSIVRCSRRGRYSREYQQ